jgi:pimeloyl-ACP methyl ester carboxylesterase
MDLLRALLGDDRLNFLGFSYGTELGATYAGLFPDRVGAMVLDGAIDITMTSFESSKQQAVGFEQALTSYVEDCLGTTLCPLTGTTADGLAQIRALLDQALEQPLPTSSGRPLTQTLAFYGVAVTLYDERSWEFLSHALDEAMTEGTGDLLLWLADFYNDRNDDGTFSSNSTEAFIAIGCLDSRDNPSDAEQQRQEAQLEQEAPTVGSFFGGGASCVDWPFPAVAWDFDKAATGSAPILVIGTTGDPATPYRWAQALASTLANGHLLTYDGEGHTAYTRSNQCIMDAVDQFLVAGTLPAEGLVC